ncbi:MAG: hypothetical protein KDB18_13620, partial [Salinibacterium sp.]|nr:hypothetical protein [Salinibacterium sp.]
PEPEVTARWLHWHAQQVASVSGTLDTALVVLARGGPAGLALADVFAARFRRHGVLRRKLVLVLALLECRAEPSKILDVPDGGGAGIVWPRLVLAAVSEALLLVAAIPVVGLVWALCALSPRSSR